MKRTTLLITTLVGLSGNAYAGGDIAPVEPVIEEAPVADFA